MTRPAEYRRRREDYPLITGHGRYVDDARMPEGRPAIFHMAVVRSPYAHARILRIDLDAARALPGVAAALSGPELVAGMPTLRSVPFQGLKQPERRPMAANRVRYVGDPVAVVLAEDLYTALDARYLVEVDYTPRPSVSDPEAALVPDAPVLYDELGTNVAFSLHSQWGDVDRVFEQAEHTVRLHLVNQRLAPSSLEP
jgi:aerobic carbon-monoxide dehydrogenase large subunit